MRVLVTGGCGFVGRHLVERLLTRGADVTILDNHSTGRWQPPPDVECYHGDITSISHILAGVSRYEAIYHLAAAVGVKTILRHPAQSMAANLCGTHAVLDFAVTHSATILLASSSEVYGKSPSLPFNEDSDLLIGPSHLTRWGYAVSKLADEHLGLAYHKEYGLKVVIARLFNIVGVGQLPDYGMVLPRFIQQALAGKPITVHGSGKQSRCFTDVRDAVRALMTLVETPEAIGDIFNIGNDSPITILELAEGVRECVRVATGRCDSEIVQLSYEDAYVDAGYEDMAARVPMIDKIQELTGWKPTIPLVETIHGIIEAEAPGVLVNGRQQFTFAA